MGGGSSVSEMKGKRCFLELSDQVVVPEDRGKGSAGHELSEVAELLAVELVLRGPARPPHGHGLKERERETMF